MSIFNEILLLISSSPLAALLLFVFVILYDHIKFENKSIEGMKWILSSAMIFAFLFVFETLDFSLIGLENSYYRWVHFSLGLLSLIFISIGIIKGISNLLLNR